MSAGQTPPRRPPRRRRLAVSTAIFSIATLASRVVGLGREILASFYYGTSGAFSAFTIAFQLPNVLRMLVADQAVTAAFVPVFTELQEQRRYAEALRLASSFFSLILVALGTVTLAFIALAPEVMPLLTGDQFSDELDSLTSGLSRLLFPVVVLLGLNGLCLGILNAYDHFTVQAIAPLVWNVVIIVVLVALRPAFSGDDQIYAYAIGVLAGTVVQFLMAFPVLARYGFRFRVSFAWRDVRLKRVLLLLAPVTISLGLIHFSLLINAVFGSLVSPEAPRSIDAAFRIFMLPWGMFALALTTVIFPTLARFAVRGDLDGLRGTAANGTRLLLLLLIPAGAALLVLAEPIVRVLFERGEFGPDSTERVAEALTFFALALPLNGVNLLFARSFFSLQRPRPALAMAAANVAVNIALAAALYGPLGIAGIVLGTVGGNVVAVAGQWLWLRAALSGFEGRATALAGGQIMLAAALLAGVAYASWYGLDGALGESLGAQIAAVGLALGAGGLVYAAAVLALRVPEAFQLRDLVVGRLRGEPAEGGS